jgi:long-chain acyl-CoA synthetase
MSPLRRAVVGATLQVASTVDRHDQGEHVGEPMSWDDAVARVTAPGERYEVVDGEIDGVPQKLFAHTPPSLRDLFAGLRQHPERVVLVYEDERWTTTELADSVDRFAAALVHECGVQVGDRVAIAMRNYPEWIVAFGAATSIGAVAVCLNAWWTAEELWYGLEDSGATVLVADSERIERAHGALDALGVAGIAVRMQGDLPPGVAGYAELTAGDGELPEQHAAPDDDAMILYPSGTTGHPKGAVSTHRAVLSALLAYGARSKVNDLTQPPQGPHPFATAFILIVPLFHVTGLVPVLLSCIAGAHKLVILYKWDPERALEHIEAEQITHFVGVPTMSWDLLESPSFAERDTSSLLSVGGGGAPAPPELVDRVERSFSKGRPSIGYGMTETNAYGPTNSAGDYVRKPTSSGRTVPVMEVAIRDDAGNDLPVGEVGEIWFKGPNLIRGYWNKPQATAETVVDGWLRSGDLGRLDDEGFVYVMDRVKDMVLRGGENIYCAEVEAAIYSHPDVHEAAVFGVPHERLGEEVAASVMPKAGHEITAEDLQAHVAEHLAVVKVPSIVAIVDEPLPRGATGKILKRSLRDGFVAHGQTARGSGS